MESSLYDDGLINEFISEAGEHLASMESDLMILEGVENAYDENLVNNIFRSAHTIKGSAGMLGFDQIAKLAHKMENLLHFVREGSLTLDHSGFQVLFQALDVLTMMVNTPQNSEDVDISQPLELLGTILPEKSRVQADQQVTIETPGRPSMFTVDQLTLELAEKSGKFVYLVEFDLIHDIHGKGKTPAHLLQDLENSGTVLNCRVEVNAVGDLDSGFSNSIPLYVLFSSVAEPALAPALFEIEEARVHHIDKPVVSAEEIEASSEAPGQNPDSEWSESVGEVKIMVRSGQALLILPQELSIMNAPLLRDAFLKVLPECQSLDVDLTAVKEADLAGLQVLCSAASTFHAHGKTISATGPIPENIVSLAKEIGFQEDSCGDSSLFFI